MCEGKENRLRLRGEKRFLMLALVAEKKVHQLIGTPSHYIIGIVKFIYQIGGWSPLEKSTVQAQ